VLIEVIIMYTSVAYCLSSVLASVFCMLTACASLAIDIIVVLVN